MKSILYIAALSLSLLPFAACSNTTDTAAEHNNRMAHAIDTNGKELVDDTDRLLLVDRPSQLSEKPIPLR